MGDEPGGVKLLAHQAELAATIRDRPRRLLQWDCGVGKTLGALAACKAWPLRTVVGAPLATLETAWARDAARIGGFNAITLSGSVSASKRRAMIADGEWDLAICTHDCLRIHADDFLRASVGRLIVDESDKIKAPPKGNNLNGIVRACVLLADQCESVIALSGKPDPQGPQDWWSQMRVVDPACLGRMYWPFIDRYATPGLVVMRKRNLPPKIRPVREWVAGGEAYVEFRSTTKFSQTDEQRAALAKRLTPWVWVLRKSDCLDLPETTDEVRTVRLSDSEREAYERIRVDLRIATADGEKSVKAQSVFIKLHQVAGGAVLVGPDEAQELGSSKLDELREVVAQIGDEPLIVWCEYRHEIRRVAAALAAIGPTAALYGDTSKDAASIVAGFRDGPTRFLVANAACCGHGTDGLQRRCSYAVFYSFGFKAGFHHQARERIHRIGMRDRPATYIYLVTEGTPDVRAHESLMGKLGEGEAMSAAIRDAVAGEKGR